MPLIKSRVHPREQCELLFFVCPAFCGACCMGGYDGAGVVFNVPALLWEGWGGVGALL